MRRTILPILAGLLAGGIVTAQTVTTDTDTQIGTKPEVRIFSSGLGLGFPFNSTGGFLGVYPAEVTDEIASKYSMDDPHGALLTKVEENTAASKAGLQVDDIIVEWNGTRVESGVMLRRMINETPVGRKVRIGYIRNGAKSTVETTIGERPEVNVFEQFRNGDIKELKELEEMNMPENLQEMLRNAPKLGMLKMVVGNGRMGATVQNLTPPLAKYYGVEENSGALVGSVREGSAAAKGGLQQGDIITAIDGEKVSNPGDVARIISSKEKGEVELRVLREKNEQTIRVTLEEKGEGMEFPNMQQFQLFQGMEPNGNGELRIVPPPAIEESAPDASQPDLGNALTPQSLLKNLPQGKYTVKIVPNEGNAPIMRRTSLRGIDI